MYQEYFGLNRPPFKITPDTSLFYEGSQRGAVLDAMTYAIKSGEGIIKVVGEVGSGKTMLCRMLELRLNNEVDVVYIANPSLSPDNILHVIAHELQLIVNNEMSKVDVMQQIQAHLLTKHASNRQVVLFVEEAQSMPIETLEEIRLLSNLETDENKLLQMVLFGQPELDEKLSVQHIRQLKERITHSFYLSPFPPDDTLQYLNFRLRAVGYKGPDIFTKKTANAVKKYSDGLTRRINIIADKALLAAFSENSYSISSSHIKTAALDSEFDKTGKNKNIIWLFFGFLLLIAALTVGYFVGKQDISVTGPIIQDSPEQDQTAQDRPIQEPIETSQMADIAVAETLPADKQSISQHIDSQAMGSQAVGIVDQIAGKMKATARWLENAALNHYSIQLFMTTTGDADKVEKFLRDMPEMLDFTKIYIYETAISGCAWYGVAYNEFDSYEKAVEVLDKLPESLRASEPYLRRISALKKDAARGPGAAWGVTI